MNKQDAVDRKRARLAVKSARVVRCRSDAENKHCPAARRLRTELAVTMYARGVMKSPEIADFLGYASYHGVLCAAKVWGVPMRKKGGRQ